MGQTGSTPSTQQGFVSRKLTQLRASPRLNRPEPDDAETAAEVENGDEAATGELLTYEQRMLIQQTWKDDFDSLYALGGRFIEDIVSRVPDPATLFEAVAKHGDNWRESKEFRRQGLKFVQVVDFIVKRLSRISSDVDPVLVGIGFRHKALVAKGFRPSFWDIFLTTMHDAVCDQMEATAELSAEEKQTVILGWQLLAGHIIKKMNEGFARRWNPEETSRKVSTRL